jgi:6-phosphogluconolactonase (cycloisomerase 2 family)
MTAAAEGRVALWVGCYTSDMEGSGEGILALTRAADGHYAPLGPATAVTSPSFLALHPSRAVLYAVSEGAELVHAYRHDEAGVLTELGAAGTAGSLVCHVAVAPDGAFLVASCWGDGSVLVFELADDGSLGTRHAAPASVDPYGEARQSRAHSCLMLGGGRFVTADMGHDKARFWRFDAVRGLEPHGDVTLPEGSGPRHFARSSSGVVYLNAEYTGEVAVLEPAGPWLALRGSFPVSARGVQPGDAGAEICLDPDERHLYVGVRGSDVICRLALDAGGVPSALDALALPGNWPRHHCFAGGQLVVALEHSHELASFTLDAGGSPAQPPHVLSSGSPTCVLPHRSGQ